MNLKSELLSLIPTLTKDAVSEFQRFITLSSQELIDYSNYTLDKPYGLNHIVQLKEDYGISFAQLNLDQSTSYHYHRIRREIFYIKTGTLSLRKNNGIEILNQGSLGSSIPFEQHSLKNDGNSLLEIIEIFVPPLLDDKVRVTDKYERKLGIVTHKE